MVAARTAAGPLRRVVKMVDSGRNKTLVMSCGHRRLHSPGVPPPFRARCAECPPGTPNDSEF